MRNLRKSRNRDLLVTVQNGADKAERLKKAIQDKCPASKTALPIDKKVLHIKVLDELTTAGKITEAIHS